MERPCEPHPSPPAPASAPATSPSPKPNPLTPPATSPAVTQLGAILPAQGCLFELAGSRHAEVGSAATVAASEDDLTGEEAAPEQLD